jgi:hypothetical protein
MMTLLYLSVLILSILLTQYLSLTTSFAPTTNLRHFATKTVSSISYSVHDEDKPIMCYLIQTEAKKKKTINNNNNNNNNNNYQDEASIPQIVCTSNPEEYAWFHGIDQDRMVLTDGIYNQAFQCVEGESPRGVPEWECESAFQ